MITHEDSICWFIAGYSLNQKLEHLGVVLRQQASDEIPELDAKDTFELYHEILDVIETYFFELNYFDLLSKKGTGDGKSNVDK